MFILMLLFVFGGSMVSGHPDLVFLFMIFYFFVHVGVFDDHFWLFQCWNVVIKYVIMQFFLDMFFFGNYGTLSHSFFFLNLQNICCIGWFFNFFVLSCFQGLKVFSILRRFLFGLLIMQTHDFVGV